MWILCLKDMDMRILDMPNPLTMCQLSLYSPISNKISGENIIIPSPSAEIDSQSDIDIHIAHRKEKKNCTLHPLRNFLFYAHLFAQYYAFVSSIDSHLFCKSVSDAMSNPN